MAALDKLADLAREAPYCMHCMGNDGTIVPAHANRLIYGKGMGIKAGRESIDGLPVPDHMIAYLCHACHHELDNGKGLSRAERYAMWDAAFARTVHWWFMNRLVVVA